MEEKEKPVDLIELAVIGQIALGIMHELGNPLQIALGYTQDIRAKISKDFPFNEDLQVIEEEIKRCGRIMDHIRAVTTAKGKRCYQDIGFTLKELLPLLNIYLRKKSLSIEESISPSLPLFIAESYQFKISLLLVLMSSISSSRDRGILRIEALEDRNTAVIRVKILTDEDALDFSQTDSYCRHAQIPMRIYREGDDVHVCELQFPID